MLCLRQVQLRRSNLAFLLVDNRQCERALSVLLLSRGHCGIKISNLTERKKAKNNCCSVKTILFCMGKSNMFLLVFKKSVICSLAERSFILMFLMLINIDWTDLFHFEAQSAIWSKTFILVLFPLYGSFTHLILLSDFSVGCHFDKNNCAQISPHQKLKKKQESLYS